MGAMLVLCLLLLFSSYINVLSQSTPANIRSVIPKASCASYKDILSDGTVGFCAGLIDYEFYLPNGYSQENLESAAYKQLLSNPSTASLLGLIPPRCGGQLKKVICASVFQKCTRIDPFFLDKSCPLGESCKADGQGSFCKNATDSIMSSGCITGPGYVYGFGNTPYSAAALLQVTTVENICTANNMTWSSSENTCLVTIPISPSKSICDELHNANTTLVVDSFGPRVKATCPIISGMFFELIINLLGQVSTMPVSVINDTYARNELLNSLIAKNCTNPLDSACYTKIYSVNFLGAFGILPSCDATLPTDSDIYAFSSTGIQETKSSARIQSLGSLIQYKTLFSSNCTASGGTLPGSCSNLLSQIQLNQGSSSIKLQAGLAFASDLESNKTLDVDGTTVKMDKECINILTNDKNQPSDQTDLLIIAAAGGKTNPSDAKGAFFVPSSLGLPPLPHIFGFKGSSSNSPYSKFMQQNDSPEHPAPLCSLKNGKIRGKNSLECLLNSVNSALNVVPKWVNPKCRTSLMELVCASGHLKPEVKRLCLVPNELGGCSKTDVESAMTSSDKFPLVFALPRFASKDTCIKANDECKSFVDYLKASDPVSAATLESALNCDQNIDITCDDNSEWQSSVWPKDTACSSSFNGKKMFPEGPSAIASLGSLDAFLTLYTTKLLGFNLHIESPQNLLVTKPTEKVLGNFSESELLSYCECPKPLRVPKKLPIEGSSTEFLCCKDVCTTSMFPPSTFQYYYDLQFYISIPSLFCAGFLFLTFVIFKAKRQQRITVYFSMTSMMLGLMFIITNSKGKATDLYCKDETEPNTQADGGLCLLQALMLTFFAVSACGWWFCQSLDLFLKVALGKRVEYLIYYHLIAWGVPSIATVIYLSTNTYGYTGPNPWCFASTIGVPLLEYYIFYGPIVFYTFFGFLMMLGVIGKIFMVTSAGQAVSQTKQSSLKRLQTFRTPTLFVFLFMFVWLILFSWKFQNLGNEPKIKDAAKKWTGCLLTNFAAGISDPATNPLANVSLIEAFIKPGNGCGETYPLKIDLNMISLVHFIALFQGVFVFLIFGAKLEIVHLWAEKLHLTSRKYDTTEDKTSQKGKTNLGTGNAKPSMLGVTKKENSYLELTSYGDTKTEMVTSSSDLQALVPSKG